MAELVCALCPNEVIGKAIILIEDDESGEQDWSNATGSLDVGDGEHPFMIVHPTCFDVIVEQTFKQEGMWMVRMGIADVGLMKEELGL